MNRFDAIRAVREAVHESDLDGRAKRRILAAIRWRPAKRAEIIGLVTAECHVEGLVTEDGEVEAAIDWRKILDYVIRLLPVILSIVMLFI